MFVEMEYRETGNHVACGEPKSRQCCDGSWESVDWCDGNNDRCRTNKDCVELKDGVCHLMSVKDLCLICGRVLE